MEERELDEDEVGSTIKIRTKKNSDFDGADTVSEEEGDAEKEVLVSYDEEAFFGEEFADLTPEEAKRLKEEREEEALALERRTQELIAEGKELLSLGKREEAEEKFSKALEKNPMNQEASLQYLLAASDNFNDYSFEKVKEIYSDGYDNLGEDYRLAVKEECADQIFARIKKLAEEAQPLQKEVEGQKEKRRAVFRRDFESKRKTLLLSLLPLLLCAALSLAFAFNISSVKNSTFLVLTAIAGTLTLVSVVFFLVCARKFFTARGRLFANEKDESTSLGRSFLALKKEIAFLSDIVK